jgi:uncharacterized membrane protein
MKKPKGIQCLFCLMPLVGVLGILLGSQVVLAAQENGNPPLPPLPNQEEPPPEEPVVERLELVSRFPVKQGESGGSFDFEVIFNYEGNESKVFEFKPTPPPGWEIASITRYVSQEQQESILAMLIEPNLTYPARIQIKLAPLPGNQPEPGEYTLTFEATSASGDLRDTIELEAVVTNLPPDYGAKFTTATGRLDYAVRGGEANLIQLKITNSGSGTLTNINFTSVKSENWGTTFSPSKIESLEPGESVDAEVNISPPRNTIAGDYRTLIRVGADTQAMRLQEELDLRIRVQTPTIWGAAGIGIVAAVIAGLAVMFRQLGRR